MELSEAKELLNPCTRDELRDHAFGNVEVFWFKEDGETQVAGGYFGRGHSSVWFSLDENAVGEHKLRQAIGADPNSVTFKGEEARELRECGMLGMIERNDVGGPDEYVEGWIKPELTLEGVRKEITTPPSKWEETNEMVQVEMWDR